MWNLVKVIATSLSALTAVSSKKEIITKYEPKYYVNIFNVRDGFAKNLMEAITNEKNENKTK